MPPVVNWILEHLYVVVVVIVFLGQVVRGLLRAKKTGAEHEAQRDDAAEARRVREVQEQIRRQIAERRGGQAPAPAQPPRMAREVDEPSSRPVPRPQTTQMPDPFGGGPLGRMLEELQKKVEQPRPVIVSPPPVMVEMRNTAELERQQRLAEDLRALDDAKALTKRRAAQVAGEQRAEAASEPGMRSAARGRVLDDLRDPASLRRAFVLREVLGPPVGLR